jgi:glutathionylspermidine synthase
LADRWRLVGLPPGAALHIAAAGDPWDAAVRPWPMEALTADALAKSAFGACQTVRLLSVAQVEWDPSSRFFYAGDGDRITHLGTTYPLEWMEAEAFGECLPVSETRFVSPPAYGRLLADKALLSVMWRLHQDHAHLLPAAVAANPEAARLALGDAVAAHERLISKPVRGNDGEDVRIEGEEPVSSFGNYAGQHLLHQLYRPLPAYDTPDGPVYAAVSVWFAGDTPVALSVREAPSPITTAANLRFVPHLSGDDISRL